jgi:hypothetical protein
MELQETLVAKEKELLLPETRHSTARLKELLSEDFVEIGQNGNKFGLNEVLEKLPREAGWSARISDIEFRMINEYVAQVFYIAIIYGDKDSKGTYSKRSSIWKNESGVWRMIFHQGTKIS